MPDRLFCDGQPGTLRESVQKEASEYDGYRDSENTNKHQKNDFSRIFVNQLRLLGQRDDMALAISTSGKSPNLIYALQAARERGMMTIALSGKDGGRLPEVAEYCFTVPSFSIHRIQEVHATMIHVLWDMIHVAIGEEDVI